MRSHVVKRLLTTTTPPPNPNSSSRGNLGRILLVTAVATPVAFVGYKWNSDPEFFKLLRDFNKQKPTQTPTSNHVVKLPLSIETLEPPQKEVVVTIHKSELDQLEQALVKDISVIFNAQEVKEVEEKIRDAEKKAEEEEEAAKKQKEKEEEEEQQQQKQLEVSKKEIEVTAAKKDNVVVITDEKKETEVEKPIERHAIESIRESARQVANEATEKAREQVVKAEASLRADIERVLVKDLSSLDLEGLRERVVQLTLELKDRNRWEAIRLHEVISKTTEELSQKYLGMLKDQETAYENVIRAEITNAALQAAANTEDKLSKSLQERLFRQKDALRMEMELNIEKAREEERQIADEERATRIRLLKDLERNLIRFEEAFKEKEKTRVELLHTKKAILAALQFSRAVLLDKTSTQNDVERSLSELRQATAGDVIIGEALDLLPHRIFAGGIFSIHRIVHEFERLQPEILALNLAPDDATFFQSVLAKASTALMITGKPSVLPSDDDSSVEAKCRRALNSLEEEDLVAAIQQVETLPTKIIAKSPGIQAWLTHAKDRLKVEATVRLLLARFEEK